MSVEMLERSAASKVSNDKTIQSRTFVLIALWTLEADKNSVKKSELPDKVKKLKDVFEQLVDEGAIITAKQGRSIVVSLKEGGLQLLDEALSQDGFEFGGQIGVKTANALLRWIRERNSSVSVPASNGKVHKAVIASYEEFKQVALDVYDRLNRDYNMGNMVPIYRVRREIGDQVSRNQFNEWLLEMQSNDVFQLLEESVEDSAPDKIEDSVTTKLGKLRCYAKRVAA
jgi:predicted transcriptional regulator